MLARPAFPASLAALTLLVPSAAGQDDPAVQWLWQNAVPFSTVEAGHGFDDLQFLKEMIGTARVVGLGEGTHGTREHFQLKHRLLEFLASEMGFTIFSIEANMPESFRVDRYVSHGEGDPAALIGGMYFWTWNTEEVLDMTRWMREFNVREAAAGSGKHLRFTGFDMQDLRYSLAIVRRFIGAHDPGFLATLDESWEAVESAQGLGAGAYGVASTLLPIDSVRTRMVRFEGSIRTEGAHDGWAGFWARVTAGTETRFFDNMQDRGPRRDSDWAPYFIEFEVAADATAVQVGTVFAGGGRARFDNLRVLIDGRPIDPAAFADSSFEETPLGPFVPGFALEKHDPAAGQYRTAAEEGPAADGARSLVMMSLIERRVSPLAAAKGAGSVLAHLQASRERYAQAGLPPADIEWTLENARLVTRCIDMNNSQNGSAARDKAMAEIVMWILAQNPGAKVVLWAHNYHVSTMDPWMGRHLRRELGDDYATIGFMAGEGTYYAMPKGDNGFIHTLQPPTAGSAESIFQKVGLPRAALDLRPVSSDEAGAEWVFGMTPFGGTIGAMRMDDRFHPIVIRDAFDFLLYVDQTSASRQLKTPPARNPPSD